MKIKYRLASILKSVNLFENKKINLNRKNIYKKKDLKNNRNGIWIKIKIYTFRKLRILKQ